MLSYLQGGKRDDTKKESRKDSGEDEEEPH